MVKNAMAKQQQNLARLSPQTNVLPATREGKECCYFLIIFTLNCLLNCLIYYFFSFLVPAIAANQKGDNNDDINDSGMDTMYFQVKKLK